MGHAFTSPVAVTVCIRAKVRCAAGLCKRRPSDDACCCGARWYGTEATDTVTLERRSHATGNDADTQALQLPERFVVPFLTGTLSEKDYIRNLRNIQVTSASKESRVSSPGHSVNAARGPGS